MRTTGICYAVSQISTALALHVNLGLAAEKNKEGRGTTAFLCGRLSNSRHTYSLNMRCVGGHHTSFQYAWREQNRLEVSYTESGPRIESILPAHDPAEVADSPWGGDEFTLGHHV